MLDDGTEIRFGLGKSEESGDAGEDGVRNDENAKFHIWQVAKCKVGDGLTFGDVQEDLGR
jgi:hypothetical protein